MFATREEVEVVFDQLSEEDKVKLIVKTLKGVAVTTERQGFNSITFYLKEAANRIGGGSPITD